MVDTRYNVMLDSGELLGTVVDVNELLDIIRGKWGDLDNDCGCYCNGNWLSIKDVVRVIVDNAFPADF